MSVLNGIAEASMQDAIEKVKALPHYATKGEVHVQVLFLYFTTIMYTVGYDRCSP